MSKKTDKPKVKRGNGRGNVRKLPSGKWQWRASLSLPNGDTVRVAGTVFTKTEADAALDRAHTDAARGQFAVTEKTTLEEYLLRWYGLRKDTQAAKYAQGQESLIRMHILPGLGRRKLTTLTPRDLEAFYTGLCHQDERREDTFGKPLGDSMKRQIHNLLHLAFNDAVRLGDLMRNPADTARPRYTRPAAQDDTLNSWTEEEAAKFYAVARQNPRGVIFCFMLSTGLRIGETLGLRWENVNPKTGIVHIREGLVSLGGHAHRTTPKTPRSRRTMEVTGDALAILREQPGRIDEAREAQGEQYVDNDYIFPSLVGTPLLTDNMYRSMKSLCAASGVPYKGTHVLRHSFISIQGLHGQMPEVVSKHVGHSRVSFTLDRYRSVFDKERKGMTLDFSVPVSSPES